MFVIDECHSTGFFGKTGRGTAEYCGVEGRIDIINSTLGKALGGATGGYTTASKPVVEMLRQRSRPCNRHSLHLSIHHSHLTINIVISFVFVQQ